MIPQKWLLALRAWIDRRVPRDKLMIDFRNGRGLSLMRIDHHEAMLQVKMHNGLWQHQLSFRGELVSVVFTLEHLTV